MSGFSTARNIALTPIFFIVWLLIWGWRLLVSLVVPLLYPNVSCIVEPRSAFIGCVSDDRASIVITSLLQPGISLYQLVEKFQHVLTLKENAVKGQRKYWKLENFVRPKWGFNFWHKDPSFRLSNHVREIFVDEDGNLTDQKPANPSVNPALLPHIETEVMNASNPRGQSPWGFWLLRNVGGKDALFLKSHHVLGDGYSLLKLLVLDLCGEDRSKLMSPKLPKMSWAEEIFLDLSSTILAPYALVSSIFEEEGEEDPFKLRKVDLRGNYGFRYLGCRPLALETIKRARIGNGGVDHLTIVLEGMTAALRNTLIRGRDKGKGFEGKESCCADPFPFPGHPDHLGNYWCEMAINLPIGEGRKETRIKSIQSIISTHKNPLTAVIAFKILPLLGTLPNFIIEGMMDYSKFSVALSDFPGPKEPVSLLGAEIKDVHFILGFPPGNVGYLFYSTSYCGKWKLNILVDDAVCEKFDGMERFIAEDVICHIEELAGSKSD